jgi:DNA polymerase III gamma/tau subunit
MPTNVMAMLQSLSRAQIERLLQAKERIETLQSRRDDLRKELAQIEATLGGLLAGTDDVARTASSSRAPTTSAATRKTTSRKAGKKAVAKRTAAKKTGAKKTAARQSAVEKTPARTTKAKKTTARKATAKKATAKKATAKTTAKKAASKAAAKKVAATGRSGGGDKRATLEDVIYNLIEKRGEAVPFQELLGTITGKKLFKTRSTNFDNVLRRTLSTSTRIKRVGRGMYGI